MFHHSALIAEASRAQLGGLSTTAVNLGRVSSSITSPQRHTTPICCPEGQLSDLTTRPPSCSPIGKARENPFAKEDRSQCTIVSSSGRNMPTTNPSSPPSLSLPQRARGEETREAPQSAASPLNARVSSHAVQPNVSRHSKVIKETNTEAEPSRSSVMRPAAPTASSSRGKTARGKKGAAPEAKSAPAKKTGKQKRELLTPLQYAQRLQERMADAATPKPRGWPYLRGMRIYYYGGDRTYASDETRGHMDHVGLFDPLTVAGCDWTLTRRNSVDNQAWRRPRARVRP